jgi:hypothetical protein
VFFLFSSLTKGEQLTATMVSTRSAHHGALV